MLDRRKLVALGILGGGAAWSPVVLLYDTFTDTNGTLMTAHTKDVGAAWIKQASDNDNKVVGNLAVTNAAAGNTVSNAGLSNVKITAKFNAAGAGAVGGLVIRALSTERYFMSWISKNSHVIYEWNGGFVSRASATPVINENQEYNIILKADGDVITSEIVGVNTLTYTSALYRYGMRCGMRLQGATLDDITVKSIYERNYNYLLHGDSLTLGTGTGNPPVDGYPGQLKALINDNRYSIMNLGIGGYTFLTLNADAATTVDPYYSASYDKNILVIWAGANDTYNQTGATVYARLQTYVAARKAANPNIKIVVVTVLPRSDAGAQPAQETNRQAFNTLLRGDYSFAHALADVAADSRIGAAGASDDTTYFNADKVHLNVSGYGIVMPIIKSAIESIA
jgi:lysophospholipase L1-like esterase